LVDASLPRPQQQHFRIASPERFCSHPVLSVTIKKRESFVPETIKKRLESYPGWSDLVRRRKKTPPMYLYIKHRPLTLRTDGGYARVGELGFIDFYCNFFKNQLTKF